MSNPPKTLRSTFTLVDTWKTADGTYYTNKALAEFMAERNGDRDPMSGYPTGPSKESKYQDGDGTLWSISSVRCGDENARRLFAEAEAKLKYWKSQT